MLQLFTFSEVQQEQQEQQEMESSLFFPQPDVQIQALQVEVVRMPHGMVSPHLCGAAIHPSSTVTKS